MDEPSGTRIIEERRWAGLHRAGAVAAFVVALVLAGEILVFAMFPRPPTALEHFELFRQNWLVGLLTLDLLGLISYLLLIPTTLAVYVAVRKDGEGLMAVATVLFFVGVADFVATNTAFPVLDLSAQYSQAGSDAERAAILAAGQAMFTLFNENAFLVSYVIVSFAWGLMGVGMLRSALFSWATALAGILGGASGIVAVVLEHAHKGLVGVAIGFYFAAIVFLLAWMILTGRHLWRLSRAAQAGSGASQTTSM